MFCTLSYHLFTSVEQWTDQQPSFSPLPPDLMDQLVSWIVQEVTQSFSPPEVSHSGSSLPPGVSNAAPFPGHGPSLGHSFHLKFAEGTRWNTHRRPSTQCCFQWGSSCYHCARTFRCCSAPPCQVRYIQLILQSPLSCSHRPALQ